VKKYLSWFESISGLRGAASGLGPSYCSIFSLHTFYRNRTYFLGNSTIDQILAELNFDGFFCVRFSKCMTLRITRGDLPRNTIGT